MKIEQATKQQLLQIALHEDCSMGFKYEACRELQLRGWNDDMLLDLIKLNGEGYSPKQIANELGIDYRTVNTKLSEYGMRGRNEINKRRNDNAGGMLQET